AYGSLGNFIIRDLLKQSQSVVKGIHCLLRGSNTKQRLFELFKQQQLEISILTESLEQHVSVNIYRVDQISDDTQNGVWNTAEIDSMIIYASAGQLKKMPNVG
ncbi:unnamed protein product, partial [Rotaria sp. Silwood1]